MASFDEPVQKVQPDNYMYWSRPIEQPRPDTSGEVKGQAIGTAIGKAGSLVDATAQWADKTEQLYIREGMQKELEGQSDSYIKQLASIDDVVSGRDEPSVLSPGNKTAEGMPSELKKFPGVVDDLLSVRDTGRISPTHFLMLRDQTFKNWRSRFPGQVDFIDQEGTRLTQRDPANRLIESLSADINAYGAAAKANQSKYETIVLNSDVPGLWDAMKAGKISLEGAVSRALQDKATKAKLQFDNVRMENLAKHNQLDEGEATRLATSTAAQMRANFWSNKTIVTPWAQGGESLTQFLQDYNSGKHPMSDEQALQVGSVMNGWINEYGTQLRNTLYDTGTPDKPKTPIATYMGGQGKAETFVTENLKELEAIRDMFTAKQIPQAVAAEASIKAMESDRGLSLLRSSNTALNMRTVANLMGPQSEANTRFFQKALELPGVPDELKAWAIASSVGLLAPQSPEFRPGSLVDTLKDGKTKGVDGPSGAKANNKVINTVADAMSPDHPVPIVTQAAKVAFGPEDQDFMTLFNTSQIDSKGNIHPGKSTAFASLVNERVTKSLKKTGDTSIQQQYLNTSTKWFGNVFQSEIETLNQMFPGSVSEDPVRAMVSEASTKAKGYEVNWDSNNLGWQVTIKGVPISATPRTQMERRARAGLPTDMSNLSFKDLDEIKYVNDAVTRLNAGIHSMVSVYHEFGGGKENINGLMLQLFIGSGLSPNDKHNTPAGQLLEALKASLPKQQGAQE